MWMDGWMGECVQASWYLAVQSEPATAPTPPTTTDASAWLTWALAALRGPRPPLPSVAELVAAGADTRAASAGAADEGEARRAASRRLADMRTSQYNRARRQLLAAMAGVGAWARAPSDAHDTGGGPAARCSLAVSLLTKVR